MRMRSGQNASRLCSAWLRSRSASKCKISIGYNPWSPIPRKHNIAAICERHGGGGHPVVGAISLAPDQLAKARDIARAVVTELGKPSH